MNQKFTARVSVEADTAVTVECRIAPISGRNAVTHGGGPTADQADIRDLENRPPAESDGQTAQATTSSSVAAAVVVDGEATPKPPPEPRPSRSESDGVTDELVAMLNQLLIDRLGDVYCRLPTDDGHVGITVPLRDQKVVSALFFLYHKKHGRNPRPSQVKTAIHRVEGEQLSRMSSDTTILDAPTWRCLKLLLGEEPSGAASAEEILKKLRAVNKKHMLLKGKEDLPLNATALGVWLTRHQFSLRDCGVEVTRPTRRAEKRLWAWQKIEPDDASDTSLLHPSATNAQQNTDVSITNDTMSGSEVLALFGESIHDTCD